MIERIYFKTDSCSLEQMLSAFKEAGNICCRIELRRNLNYFAGGVRDVAEMIQTARHATYYALKETTVDGFVEYEIGCRFCRFDDDDCVCNVRMVPAHGKALFEKYGFEEHQ